MSKIVTLCQSETGGTLAARRGRCAVNMSFVVLLTSATSLCFPCPFVLRGDGGTRRSTVVLGCWAKGGDGLRLGWDTFAKQNVEELLQHLLLSPASKTGSSYPRYTRANGQTLNICSYLFEDTVKLITHYNLNFICPPCIPHPPQNSPYLDTA